MDRNRTDPSAIAGVRVFQRGRVVVDGVRRTPADRCRLCGFGNRVRHFPVWKHLLTPTLTPIGTAVSSAPFADLERGFRRFDTGDPGYEINRGNGKLEIVRPADPLKSRSRSGMFSVVARTTLPTLPMAASGRGRTCPPGRSGKTAPSLQMRPAISSFARGEPKAISHPPLESHAERPHFETDRRRRVGA